MNDSKAKRGGAKAKLRAYIIENVGRVMSSDELRAVANGRSEWARRIRELRTEEGYQILTHHDRSDLKPGQYLMLDPIHCQHLNEVYQKKHAPLCLIAMDLHVRCVVRWPANNIPMMLHARHDCILVILLINLWVEQMMQAIYAQYARSVMKGHQISL